VLDQCFPERAPDAETKVVGAKIDGEPYYACYAISGDSGGSIEAAVLDARGRFVGDADLIKRAGAWPWVGWVTSGTEFAVNGAISILVLVFLGLLFWLISRPGGGWRIAGIVMVGVVVAILALIEFAMVALILLRPDSWGLAAVALAWSAFVYGGLGGGLLIGRYDVARLVPGGSRDRRLVLGLLLSIAAAPVLFVGGVFLSALGEVPVTTTLAAGFAGLALGTAAFAAICVALAWRAEGHVSAAPTRPAALRAVACGGCVALGAVALTVVTSAAASVAPHRFDIEAEEGWRSYRPGSSRRPTRSAPSRARAAGRCGASSARRTSARCSSQTRRARYGLWRASSTETR
jgi:hypothetical protein